MMMISPPIGNHEEKEWFKEETGQFCPFIWDFTTTTRAQNKFSTRTGSRDPGEWKWFRN
jgi:hypothetical protein